jgi:hypothetical protein
MTMSRGLVGLPRWAVGQGALVLSVLLCGVVVAATMQVSTPVGTDTLRLVSSAGQAVAATGSYRMELTFRIDGPGGDVEVKGRADLTAAGDGVGEFELPDAGPLRFRVVAGRGWYELPEASPLRLGGKRWVGFPADAGAVTPVQDPLALLSLLSGGAAARDFGAEEVRGVPTRHFRSPVDSRALSTLAGQQQGLPLPAGGLDGVDVDGFVHVWLADDGLPRRLRVELEVLDMDLRVELELFEFGGPVDVTPPDEAEVIEVGSQQEAVQYLTGG